MTMARPEQLTRTPPGRPGILVRMLAGGLLLSGVACSRNDAPPAAPDPPGAAGAATPAEARAIAREAYVYLYPMVQNYQTIYQFALDTTSPEFKGPMNTIVNVARVFTPRDTTIVTANSDTPYSYLIMDLRREPQVVTLPPIERNRYYSLQLVDLYTHNVDYLGTRKDGNDGGRFLIAGPDWSGETAPGIRRVIRVPTQIMFGQFRTQLFDPGDLPRVEAIQAQYRVQPLSAYLGVPPPAAPPEISYPRITQARIATDFWQYASFLLQFAPPLAGEEPLRARFARIGIVPGGDWPAAGTPAGILAAVDDGMQETRAELDAEARKLASSAGLFGTPELMRGKYRERALGAWAGIYGNDIGETFYVSYQLDAGGALLDAATRQYTLTFGPDALPPVDAFWSLTMYDAKTRLMVDNPIDRYLINSSMLPRLRRNADGGVTLYLQHQSPGEALESNWLPAPAGPMGMVLRMYLPQRAALDGTWVAPPVAEARAAGTSP